MDPDAFHPLTPVPRAADRPGHFPFPMKKFADPLQLDGVLLVDKPPDHTSHDVVARIRGRFRLLKVGHGGTLDPAATGLLAILLGRATKLSGRIMGHDKAYEGVIRLGAETDTFDAQGRIVRCAPDETMARVSFADAAREAAAMRGDRLQVPPMVSACKINGVPLYKLARKGEEVERKARLVHVYEFTLREGAAAWPDAAFRVRCTKGTYIRVLASELGAALGVGAHLLSLRRTASGPFEVKEAVELETLLAGDSPEPYVLPIPDVLARLDAW